jgi:hypothetical protein
VAASSRPDGGQSKLDCFIRFDEVNRWLLKTRDLITNAETYSCPAFIRSFRQLRRHARRADFELVIAFFQFERAMRSVSQSTQIKNGEANANKQRQ